MKKNSILTVLPVDNGNMTLFKLNDLNKTTILYDMYIRDKSTNKNDDSYDVLEYLNKNVEYDSLKRPFIDVFILSHHDDDHIRGFESYFHMGDLSTYKIDDKKIYIKEIWGSVRFLKRASKFNVLETNAKSFNTEMNRRFNLFMENKKIQSVGNRIKILGNCPDGGTKDAKKIVCSIGDNTSILNNINLKEKINILVLAPLEQQKGEDDKSFQKKNRGSVILNIDIHEAKYTNKILLTGDAEVDVCEYLNEKYGKDELEYDILLSPHHCSKYSFYRKINDDESKFYEKAFKSLSYAKVGARIIASCREFGKDTPPHTDAKDKYIGLVGKNNFFYTAGNKISGKIKPIEFELTNAGTKKLLLQTASISTVAATEAVGSARGHG